MYVRPKTISEGFIKKERLFSFEEAAENKDPLLNFPPQIEESDAIDPAEYWEAINDRDKRIETLCLENEKLIEENSTQAKNNQFLTQDCENLKRKLEELDQNYAVSYRAFEQKINDLENYVSDFKEKLEKSIILIEELEENNKNLESLVGEFKGEKVDNEADFSNKVEKNLEEMIFLENSNNNLYKETIQSIKALYEKKLEDLKNSYEEKIEKMSVLNHTNGSNSQNQENVIKDLEKIQNEYEKIKQEKEQTDEKVKILGYSCLNEVIDENKALWEEINMLKKAQETYKKENEVLHHELDYSIEKFEKKENEFNEKLSQKEKEIQEIKSLDHENLQNLQILQEAKQILEENLKKQEKNFEERIEVIQQENQKILHNFNSIQAKYEENLQKIYKDGEIMKKMKQDLREKEEKFTELQQRFSQKTEMNKIISNKIQNIHTIFAHFKQIYSEIKKSYKELSKQFHSQLAETNHNILDQIQKILKKNKISIENSPLFPKTTSSQNIPSKESSIIAKIQARNSNQSPETQKILLASSQKPSFLLPLNEKKVEKVLVPKSYFSTEEFHHPETVKRRGNFNNLNNIKTNTSQESNAQDSTDDKISKEIKFLKEGFSALQSEHVKIVEIIDDTFKNQGNRVKNEMFLFNYFEKIFDRLSLSLQKENEIKSILQVIAEKIERVSNDIPNKSQFNEIDSLKGVNSQLMKELQAKNENIILLENEKNEYKKQCKELLIQLDFKKAQSQFEKEKEKESQKIQKPANKNKNYGDVVEIYQKYLKDKTQEISVKQSDVNVTPRTPSNNLMKNMSKTINKINVDPPRQKEVKTNSFLNSSLNRSANNEMK